MYTRGLFVALVAMEYRSILPEFVKVIVSNSQEVEWSILFVIDDVIDATNRWKNVGYYPCEQTTIWHWLIWFIISRFDPVPYIVGFCASGVCIDGNLHAECNAFDDRLSFPL